MQQRLLFAFLFFCLSVGSLSAQLSGIKTIPGDYATVAAAVTDLNAQGVGAGGVTFNIAAGHTETLTGRIGLIVSGSVANPIVFQKSGMGANPLLTAYTGANLPTSAERDGMFSLAGSDWVTIDGIDLQENPANGTPTQLMEYGYGLFKASASDGCQNVTIRNCVITLSRENTAAWSGSGHVGSAGIVLLNCTPTVNTALTVISSDGSNSFNSIRNNTIQNVHNGIALVGFAAASPFTLGDTGNDIGGTMASTGNTIINYGGGAAAATQSNGIYATQQWGLNIAYNTINNNNGGGVDHVNILRGIFTETATSAALTCTHNTITLKSAATTSQLTFIQNGMGITPAGNTVTISNNTLTGEYLTATSGVFYGIYNTASPATLRIENNNISNLSYSAPALTGSGALYPIWTSGSNAAMVNEIRNNTISGVTRTGTTGATTIGIYVSGGVAGMIVNVKNNTVQNMSIDGTGATSTMYGIQTSTGTIAVDSNTINNLACLKTTGTSVLYGIYNISSPTIESYSDNTISNINHSGTGTTYGLVCIHDDGYQDGGAQYDLQRVHGGAHRIRHSDVQQFTLHFPEQGVQYPKQFIGSAYGGWYHGDLYRHEWFRGYLQQSDW
jgi:hypothetical protein